MLAPLAHEVVDLFLVLFEGVLFVDTEVSCELHPLVVESHWIFALGHDLVEGAPHPLVDGEKLCLLAYLVLDLLHGEFSLVGVSWGGVGHQPLTLGHR